MGLQLMRIIINLAIIFPDHLVNKMSANGANAHCSFQEFKVMKDNDIKQREGEKMLKLEKLE